MAVHSLGLLIAWREDTLDAVGSGPMPVAIRLSIEAESVRAR